MSETVTSLLVIFSEVALLLAIVVSLIIFFFVKRGRRDKVLARTLVGTLKEKEPDRRERLKEILQKVHQMDEENAAKSAEALINCEKALYSRVLKIFLGRDRECITHLNRDVESLAESYRKLSSVMEEEGDEKYRSTDNPLIQAQLRAEIKKLEKEKAKLQRDLDEAMTSMDNMLREYTQMYAGGAKRDGVKHLENELSQLKQKIREGYGEGEEGEETEVATETPETGDAPPPETKPAE